MRTGRLVPAAILAAVWPDVSGRERLAGSRRTRKPPSAWRKSHMSAAPDAGFAGAHRIAAAARNAIGRSTWRRASESIRMYMSRSGMLGLVGAWQTISVRRTTSSMGFAGPAITSLTARSSLRDPWNYGTELGRWVLGRSRLGTTSEHHWVSRPAPATGASAGRMTVGPFRRRGRGSLGRGNSLVRACTLEARPAAAGR